MADTDLFMECEEEELEPWQQINEPTWEEYQSVADSKSTTVSSAPAVTAAASTASNPVMVSSVMPASSKVTSVPLLPNTLSSTVPSEIPKPGPGQPMVLTQSGGGLSAVALSQVLLPSPSLGTSGGNNQPIFFTTQGLPVQNVQQGRSPMGIVLKVQQGQTVRPITLVTAPGPQVFKPVVGGTQILNPPSQVTPVAPPANKVSTPRSFAAVQIPVTLTIRSTAQSTATASATVAQPSVSNTGLPLNPQTKIVTMKPVEGGMDVQNLVNLVKTVNLPPCTQPQTFVVIGNQKSNGTTSNSAPVNILQKQNIVQTVSPATYVAPPYKVCPQCGAQFKMIEALRGHMCFCCPQLTQTLKASSTSSSTTITTITSSSSSSSSASSKESVRAPLPGQPVGSPPEQASTQASQVPNADGSEPRLVMLVDDFYYGTYEGNRAYVPGDHAKERMQFKCLSCAKKLKNNIKLMNHMKHHVELEQQNGEVDPHTSCQHCYRRFPTPFRLQCHLESVHSSYESTTKCKICEWSFESEPVFLQHMKNTHKPGEMPYVCQVCDYRSSFYMDVYNHFRIWHEDTRYLLCVYCLKVFKHSTTYQQHYIRHQKSTVYGCNKCRLQFLFTKDKVEHKVSHHKTFRKPRQLEGLTPGTKVTIRAYAGGQKNSKGQSSPGTPKMPTVPQSSTNPPQAEQISSTQALTTAIHTRTQLPQTLRPAKKEVSKMFDILSKFQEQRALLGRQKCLECTFDVPDFSNHYPTYVHCSLCPYSTCCSRAYANHMINNHVPRKTHRALAKSKQPTSWFKLKCASCEFTTQHGDLMAKHLVQLPGHCFSRFTLKGNPKIGFTGTKRKSMSYGDPTCNSLPKRSHPGTSKKSPVETSSREMDLDEEMAPLEDADEDTDDSQGEESDEQEDIVVTSNSEKPKSSSEPAVPPKGESKLPVKTETLSVRQLRIVLFALCCGIAKASESLATDPKLITAWLREKESQLEGGNDRGSRDGVERLVEWVLTQREQQLPVNEKNLFQKASQIHSQTNQSGSFRISYEWAVGFMLQHNLGLQTTCTLGRKLPRNLKENCGHFSEFVLRQTELHSLHDSVIGAMDELSVFVDFNMITDSSAVSRKAAFQFVGTGESLVNIYLAMMADGTMLPPMLFFKGQLPARLSKGLPESIVLEAQVEGFTEVEEMKRWTARVWQHYMKQQSMTKAMLVLDSHRTHMSEECLSTISSTGTLPAVIPAGCSGQLQPLDMCVRPVLQRFLLARWTQLVEVGGETGAKPGDLVELLVAWLVETVTCLSRQPKSIHRSFSLSSVISEQADVQNPEAAQLDLLHTLTQAMIGSEATQPEWTSGAEEDSEETVEALADKTEDENTKKTVVISASEHVLPLNLEKDRTLTPCQASEDAEMSIAPST